jgi:hypothetical protein
MHGKIRLGCLCGLDLFALQRSRDRVKIVMSIRCHKRREIYWPSKDFLMILFFEVKIHPVRGHEGTEGELKYSSTLSLT